MSASSTPLSPAETEAVAWFVRNQTGGGEDPGFDAWCALDPRHEAAYARIDALWGSSTLGGAAATVRTRQRRGRAARSVALALPLLLAVSLGTAKTQGLNVAAPADHATRIGDRSETRLDDGTRVTLDTGSAIDVDYSASERVIRLRRGRVFVDVAPEARPFRVESRDVVIRDIGTGFSAVRDGDATVAAVRNGEVELSDQRQGGGVQRLVAGQRGGAAPSGFQDVVTIDPLTEFGWTRDRLYFTDRPLGEVVAELRRYHRGWIVLGDPRVAEMRISGGLRLDDPPAAMAELARLSGVRLVRISDAVLILG